MTSSPPSLSINRIAIIRRIRSMGYGRILDLPVVNCEPIVEEARVIQRHKLTRHSIEGREKQNWDLCEEELRLFAHFDELENGTILVIEVQHGKPCHIEIDRHDKLLRN